MILQDILRVKGTSVLTISPLAVLEEVVQKLVRFNCGSLVVCQEDQMQSTPLGIITERDILRACASGKGSLAEIRVADAMSEDVITGTPQDSLEDTMGLMTERRIRHLPILDGEKLAGIISIGDVVKAQHDHLTMENHYLKSYIHG